MKKKSKAYWSDVYVAKEKGRYLLYSPYRSMGMIGKKEGYKTKKEAIKEGMKYDAFGRKKKLIKGVV